MSIDSLSINTIRFLAIDAIQKANSGHPGMPMGCAPIAYLLYSKIMKHNPSNPDWLNRDRFVLSAGHGSMLLYAILHLAGYKISIDDIKQFRQWQSITPGHPEYGLTEGVETTTGPLGQGFANAIGMAAAEAKLADYFNTDAHTVIDHFIYGICSDGDLMEGVSHEAASIAGHLKLGSIIFFYDDNGITIDGKTNMSFSDDTAKRFEAYGWQVLYVDDGNDLEALEKAVKEAQADERPSLIITKTHIGFGSPNKQDTPGVHGSPLGDEETQKTKSNLNWNYPEPFTVPAEVKEHFDSLKADFQKYEADWNNKYEAYKKDNPEKAELLLSIMKGDFGTGWKDALPQFTDFTEKLATRKASAQVLNAIAGSLPTLMSGSADLHASNNTLIKSSKPFQHNTYDGNNIYYGIREHGMASMMNGMALYGGVIPYGGTFLVFSDYLRPAIRIAALSHIKPIFVFTHDSIGLGEDGPTHQPIEHLASLRAIPNLLVIRPADANETVYAWQAVIEHKGGPAAIILTRQGVPVLDRTLCAPADGVLKGAYTIKESSGKPDAIIIATGSEVAPSLKAAEMLQEKGKSIRVVSMPSWELFEKQPDEYKNQILPPDCIRRVSVEAGSTFGWQRWVGTEGIALGIDRFGASAPAGVLMDKFGFTAENIAGKVLDVFE